jgi:hypothetical protein
VHAIGRERAIPEAGEHLRVGGLALEVGHFLALSREL